MNKEEIIKLVAATLGVNKAAALSSHTPEHVDARYIMFTMMLEHDIPFWEVVEACKLNRTAFYRVKESVDARLGKDEVFSKKYMACEAALVAIEEKGDLQW